MGTCCVLLCFVQIDEMAYLQMQAEDLQQVPESWLLNA